MTARSQLLPSQTSVAGEVSVSGRLFVVQTDTNIARGDDEARGGGTRVEMIFDVTRGRVQVERATVARAVDLKCGPQASLIEGEHGLLAAVLISVGDVQAINAWHFAERDVLVPEVQLLVHSFN